MIKWYFPSNDYGEKKGINDSGIATFRGTPLRSLAREICQNSLDAARSETIRIDFNAFTIKPDDVPGCEVLSDTFRRCLEFWNDQKAITTKHFFTNAIEKINAESVNVLRISDFNTTGLRGSREEINTDWTNLTKSSGVSDKKGSSGGSFGIGKFAPFACSDFSTVFYSTYDIDGLEASQGVSRLVTFRRDDDQTTQGVGYYGEDRNTPTYSQLYLDPDFKRNSGEYGTDIYILGYKHMNEEGGWEKSIVLSVLDSFLGAIWNQKLIVNVGKIEISKAKLKDLIETYADELTGYTQYYYEVLTNTLTKWYKEDLLGLGEVCLGLLVGNQEMHRKVAMIRQTGMKIKDQDRISSYIPFAGIMFINGEKLNAELKVLENPEHTEWQVARADNEVKAKALLKSMNDFIKKHLEKLVSEGNQEDFDVVGLGAFLPDEDEPNGTKNKEESVLDKPIEIKKSIPIKKKAIIAGGNVGGTKGNEIKDEGFVQGETVLGYINKQGKNKHGEKIEPYPVDPVSEKRKSSSQRIEIIPEKLRIICMDKHEGKYVVMFIPNSSGQKGTISFELVAESTNYPAPITSASVMGQGEATIFGNTIMGVDFNKDVPIRLTLQLDYYDYCSMEVRAHADKE